MNGTGLLGKKEVQRIIGLMLIVCRKRSESISYVCKLKLFFFFEKLYIYNAPTPSVNPIMEDRSRC